MNTFFPTPNRIRLTYGFAPFQMKRAALSQAALDEANAFFRTEYTPADFCGESCLVTIGDTGATVYAGGDAGAHYARLALESLCTQKRSLPKGRFVLIPFLKKRQAVLRAPEARSFACCMALLSEIARLRYNEIFFRDRFNSDMTEGQIGAIVRFCEENFIRTNLLDRDACAEADFELDAASIVGFELRTRYDYIEKIGDVKVSYMGGYTPEALADSGFLFRLSIGALAMLSPDFGNSYWDKALPGAMANCRRMMRGLTGERAFAPSDSYPLSFSEPIDSPFVMVPEGCDALRVTHTLLAPPACESEAFAYTLSFSDGTRRVVPLCPGRNIGLADADWSHNYNNVDHRFDTDDSLKTACCYTELIPAIDAGSQKTTYYALTLSGEGKRITSLSLTLPAACRVRIRSVEALHLDESEAKPDVAVG